MEDQPEKSDLKLHRRDTPHYLKNKRINLTSQTDDEAAALIHQVLAKASSPQNEQPPSLPVEEERVRYMLWKNDDVGMPRKKYDKFQDWSCVRVC